MESQGLRLRDHALVPGYFVKGVKLMVKDIMG